MTDGGRVPCTPRLSAVGDAVGTLAELEVAALVAELPDSGGDAVELWDVDEYIGKKDGVPRGQTTKEIKRTMDR